MPVDVDNPVNFVDVDNPVNFVDVDNPVNFLWSRYVESW